LQILKDQFDKLRSNESNEAESVPSLEEILDADIRRRFGQMISRPAVETAARQLSGLRRK
jgi:hypothetical protein